MISYSVDGVLRRHYSGAFSGIIIVPNCIVCRSPNTSRQEGVGDFARFDCPRCGLFALTGTAEAFLERMLAEVPLRRSLISHTLRRMQRRGERPRVLGKDDLPTLWRQDRLPTPVQQADNFILWVGDNQETATMWLATTASVIAATAGMDVLPDGNSQGSWGWLHAQLEPKGLYQLNDQPGGKIGIRLTLAGWDKHAALKKAKAESRTAFMAMKFGEPSLDEAVKDCFRPAVERTGFALRVLTDQQAAGLIDDQIRAGLLSARFVISDLTHGSQNAYWEAGFGEGRGIPVIYTCEKKAWEKSKSHFDTNHMVTILWDSAELKRAEDALAATIRATLRAEAKQTDE